MSWMDSLLQQGYVPQGAEPLTITEPGGAPQQNIQTDRLSNLLRALKQDEQDKQMRFQEQQKKMQNQTDMYTKLREAGYDPKSAYEAIQKNEMPSAPGEGATKGALEQQKAQADIDYKKASTKKMEVEAAGGGAAGRRADQLKFYNSTKLRQEFINRPEVKDYVTVGTSVESMDSLLNNAMQGNIQNATALDQALITMYNKLTDPQSVVRESEYARTPENLPVVNQMLGAIQKIQSGGAGLTNSDRQALVLGAKIIANQRGKTYNKTLAEYQGLANNYDMDIDLITRGQSKHQDYDVGQVQAESQGGIQEGQTATNPKTGQQIIFRGGQWQAM